MSDIIFWKLVSRIQNGYCTAKKLRNLLARTHSHLPTIRSHTHPPASPTCLTPVPDKKIPAFLRAKKNPTEVGLGLRGA
jgi:hypothetical protein